MKKFARLKIKLVHRLGNHLGGDLSAHLFPLLLIPDFRAVGSAHDDKVLLQLCVLAQVLGDENSPLLVRLHLGGAGKQKPLQSSRFGEREVVELLGQLVPLLIGVDKEALIAQTFREDKALAQVLAALLGS